MPTHSFRRSGYVNGESFILKAGVAGAAWLKHGGIAEHGGRKGKCVGRVELVKMALIGSTEVFTYGGNRYLII